MGVENGMYEGVTLAKNVQDPKKKAHFTYSVDAPGMTIRAVAARMAAAVARSLSRTEVEKESSSRTMISLSQAVLNKKGIFRKSPSTSTGAGIENLLPWTSLWKKFWNIYYPTEW